MGRTLITILTTIATALAGCQVSTSPKPVSHLGDGKPPSMTRAEWDGQYTLYQIPADKKAPRSAVQTVHLKKADAVGFRVRETGVVAVAGDLETTVAIGVYEWVMAPDPGQRDPVATAILVTVIVVAVIAVTAAIVVIVNAAGQASLANNL